MAPMAGITNLPFRLIARKMGAGLVTTEMISATGLMLSQERTLHYLKSHKDEKPLSVQLFGSEPEIIADACRIAIERGADIIDINMGCPVKKVIKTGAGGSLMQSPERVRQIVKGVRRVCSVPLTVKIRSGWSIETPSACEIARVIEEEGADAITVHPRYVKQGFSGSADWSFISKVKNLLKIPVIGSGDAFTPDLVLEMKRRTCCDGVMIGRGAIGNPWIFRQAVDLDKNGAFRTPELRERKALIIEHFMLLNSFFGELRASKKMRTLLVWYTKGLPNSSGFRRSFTCVNDYGSILSALDNYFLYIGEN